MVREEDPDRLVTYANYPTAEYLPLDGLDFLTFNVFLEDSEDFRRYLTRLHHLAGDRPLVLGEVGLDVAAPSGEESAGGGCSTGSSRPPSSAGSPARACSRGPTSGGSATQPVEGWHFGLTRERPLAAAGARRRVAGGTARTVRRPRRSTWPSISVVVCAYNAAATLDECLAPHVRARLPGPRGHRRRRRLDRRHRRDRPPSPGRG